MTERKLRVAVVFGGRAEDHAGSCLSAGSVLSQLDSSRFDVIPIGVTTHGSWVLESAARKALPAGDAVPAAPSEPSAPQEVGEVLGAVDVVFPVFHGTYGEDGTIQGLLELAGVPYAGAGVLATAAAMDGEFSRKLLTAEGLPVAPFVVLRRGVPTLSEEAQDRLGLPARVTPARGGNGTRITNWADLPEAITKARQTDAKVIVEADPQGREIHCGVLEYPNGRTDASLPAESHDGQDADIPAKLPDDVVARVRDLAVRAFQALNCQGMASIGFTVTQTDTVTIRHINTMPAFDTTSLYPRMWAVTGIDTPTLLTALVETAVAKGTGLR